MSSSAFLYVSPVATPHDSECLMLIVVGRNEEFLKLAVVVTTDIVRDGFVLKLFPNALKP